MSLKEKLEKNKILVVGVAILGFGVGFFIWNSSLPSVKTKVKKEKEKEIASTQLEKIKIDFDIVDSEYLKGLKKIGSIPEYQLPIGRDNPFIKP